MVSNVFSKVLVANRGEIALRVLKTAKAMGYDTVAVYSEADADSPHVQCADEAVCIGPAQVNQSYLVIENIINACKITGADAVHPGYGFLSENTKFCAACQSNGITFIGPNPKAIELMGDKRLAKIEMQNSGVPCIPGYVGKDQAENTLVREAKSIGYPVMIKASAGGGGRGMRLVWSEADFKGELKSAKSEALNAFGSDEVILEKAVLEPRHIEIQIFSDRYGNCIYLGERDCSIQRRHQKVVEEAPSPFVTPELRTKMGEAAVQAAKACEYIGAGTVEFLTDSEGNFYFLEMNTRLQVEHPVTELVTGVDLVAWQLDIAAGGVLALNQDQVSIKGHAIEVRLYAEDPANGFMPQTGKILQWQYLQSEGLRMDAGIQTHQQVSPFYDPMLAKVIAYGKDREEARRKLMGSLKHLTLLGVKSNRGFLFNILKHAEFSSGRATTAFIEKHFSKDDTLTPQPLAYEQKALSAWLFYLRSGLHNVQTKERAFWRNSNPASTCYILNHEYGKFSAVIKVVDAQNTQFTVNVDEAEFELKLICLADRSIQYSIEGVQKSIAFSFDEKNTLYLSSHEGCTAIMDITHAPPTLEEGKGSGKIKAPMDGTIIDVLTEKGAQVTKGQTLAIVEAMKMEHAMKADIDGVVISVLVVKGDQVKGRQLLVEVEANKKESTD